MATQERLFGAESEPPTTWTVPQLAAQISQVTANAFPHEIWVQGQIRNLSRSNSGHAYFALAESVEAGREPKAQISVTLLAAERASVNATLRNAGGAVKFSDGIEVRIRGRLNWYTPRGSMQVKMTAIDPAFTLGRLQADRDRLIAALKADGLLEANGAHGVPLVPLRVGLVTSRGTAAHADAMAELERSAKAFDVCFVDVRTQGAAAEPSVTRALRQLAAQPPEKRVDVVLLVRGGGARTDLVAFDSERVARAIAEMPMPVFTGLGHETDRTVADEVAHTAHKTPTAAAAAVVDRVAEFMTRVDTCWHRARGAALASADVSAKRLGRRRSRVARAATSAVARHVRTLDHHSLRIVRAEAVLERAEQRLNDDTDAVGRRAEAAFRLAAQTLAAHDARAKAHDPALALAKGWTITTTPEGRPILDPSTLDTGDEIVTRFRHGTLTSAVVGFEASPDPSPDDTHREDAHRDGR